MADEQEWHATTPRRPRDPVKAVLSVVAGLGGCALLWALALMATFAVDPDRPSNPADNTTSSHATPPGDYTRGDRTRVTTTADRSATPGDPVNRPAADTTHAAPRFPITVDAYDFRQLSHDNQAWAGNQRRDDDRFEAMTGNDVDYSWPQAYWYPDWLTVIVARSFLDATGHRYQIISDLDDPLAESAAHTLWRPCPEHRCGRCDVAPICSYVILTAYPGEPTATPADSATRATGEAPPPAGSC